MMCSRAWPAEHGVQTSGWAARRWGRQSTGLPVSATISIFSARRRSNWVMPPASCVESAIVIFV